MDDPAQPRVLQFVTPTWDEEEGRALGMRTVGWGLLFPDGSATTMPPDGGSATVWARLADAAEQLDAYVMPAEPLLASELLRALESRPAGDGTAGPRPPLALTDRGTAR